MSRRRRGHGGRYDDTHWRTTRRHILDRDSHTCQIQGPGCTTYATEVDHIIPLAAGGARLDPTNLRAACKHCNAARSSQQRREKWRGGSDPESHLPPITLVVGPPASGKTSWVEARAGVNDVIIDLDRLITAFGGRAWGDRRGAWKAAMGGRGRVIDMARRGELDCDHIWITSTNPDAPNLYPHHHLEILDPGIDVVLERIRSDPHRPAGQADAARRWYDNPPGTTSSRNW